MKKIFILITKEIHIHLKIFYVNTVLMKVRKAGILIFCWWKQKSEQHFEKSIW